VSGLDPRQVAPWRLALVVLVALGAGLRLWVLARSHGSNDIILWEIFAKEIYEHGVAHCYERYRMFNHPPLMGYWAFTAYAASKLLGVRFELLFKLAPLAAEIATAVLLYRSWQERQGRGLQAVAALALAMVSLLVGSYHGNTDLMLAYLCFLAAYLLDRERPLGAGLALAAAVNVKIMPLLLIPLFALRCRRWRDLRALVAGLSVGALPFIAFFLVTPGAFFRNVFGYQAPIPANWGFYALLVQAKYVQNMPVAISSLLIPFWSHGRYLVVAAALLMAVMGRFRRSLTARELTAGAVTAFLLLTPGFGVQYTVWCLPLFLSISLARSLVYSSVAGIYLLVFYLQFWNHKPLFESDASGPTSVEFTLVGLIVWTLLWTWLVWILRRRTSSDSLPVRASPRAWSSADA
jgi:hypothetical protein